MSSGGTVGEINTPNTLLRVVRVVGGEGMGKQTTAMFETHEFIDFDQEDLTS